MYGRNSLRFGVTCGKVLLSTLIFTFSIVAAKEIINVKHGALSASIASTNSSHTNNHFYFRDLTGDGLDELVYIGQDKKSSSALYSLNISTIVGNQIIVKWKYESISGARILVGNIDKDRPAEIVLFCEARTYCSSETSLRVIDWYEGNYRIIQGGDYYATLGTLMDSDGDGTVELLLSTERQKKYHEGRHWNPATLLILQFDPNTNKFFVEHKYDLPYGVQALASGDLLGIGSEEIITIEGDQGEKSHLGIYSIDEINGIYKLTEAKNMVDNISFLDTFENSLGTFIYIQQRWWGWTSIVELDCTNDRKCTIKSNHPLHPLVHRDAIRSTLAHSVELNQYFVNVGLNQFRMYSETELRCILEICRRKE